jgi:hypothetical protein
MIIFMMKYLIKRERKVNYFKGSGSCGISTISKYKKTKEDIDKLILAKSALVQSNFDKNAVQVTGKI